MTNLKKEARLFLNEMSERSFFFNSANSLLVGSIHGQLVCVLVIDGQRKLSLNEIKFISKIKDALGEFFTVRSMADLTETAKIKGWIE